jgi:hypothetical protein
MRAAVAASDQHQRQDEAERRDGGAAEERRLEALVQRVRQPCRVASGACHDVGRARIGDRRQHRKPERAADLLRGVDQPAREP